MISVYSKCMAGGAGRYADLHLPRGKKAHKTIMERTCGMLANLRDVVHEAKRVAVAPAGPDRGPLEKPYLPTRLDFRELAPLATEAAYATFLGIVYRWDDDCAGGVERTDLNEEDRKDLSHMLKKDSVAMFPLAAYFDFPQLAAYLLTYNFLRRCLRIPADVDRMLRLSNELGAGPLRQTLTDVFVEGRLDDPGHRRLVKRMVEDRWADCILSSNSHLTHLHHRAVEHVTKLLCSPQDGEATYDAIAWDRVEAGLARKLLRLVFQMNKVNAPRRQHGGVKAVREHLEQRVLAMEAKQAEIQAEMQQYLAEEVEAANQAELEMQQHLAAEEEEEDFVLDFDINDV